MVVPADSALTFASWITGPSAVGSENGIPSSIRSAPASAIAHTSFSVVSRSGSPQVKNGINALPSLNASLILVINILPSVACDRCAVFVSSSGNVDNDDLVFSHSRRQLLCIGNCMGRLNGRNDAFGS